MSKPHAVVEQQHAAMSCSAGSRTPTGVATLVVTILY